MGQHVQSRSKMLSKYKSFGFSLWNEATNKQKLSAKASAEPHYNESDWPSFDPTVPVGLKYVDIGASNKCSVCCDYLEPLAISILNHCCSSKHYQNMCIFSKELQNKVQVVTEVKDKSGVIKVENKITFNSKENLIPL